MTKKECTCYEGPTVGLQWLQNMGKYLVVLSEEASGATNVSGCRGRSQRNFGFMSLRAEDKVARATLPRRADDVSPFATPALMVGITSSTIKKEERSGFHV